MSKTLQYFSNSKIKMSKQLFQQQINEQLWMPTLKNLDNENPSNQRYDQILVSSRENKNDLIQSCNLFAFYIETTFSVSVEKVNDFKFSVECLFIFSTHHPPISNWFYFFLTKNNRKRHFFKLISVKSRERVFHSSQMSGWKRVSFESRATLLSLFKKTLSSLLKETLLSLLKETNLEESFNRLPVFKIWKSLNFK